MHTSSCQRIDCAGQAMQLLVHSNTKASHWRNCWMDDDDLDELYEDVVDSPGSSDAKCMSENSRGRACHPENVWSILLVGRSCLWGLTMNNREVYQDADNHGGYMGLPVYPQVIQPEVSDDLNLWFKVRPYECSY